MPPRIPVPDFPEIDPTTFTPADSRALRPAQVFVADAVERALEDEKRGHVIIECGFGKTAVDLELLERFAEHRGAKRVLLMVPRLQLGVQQRKEFERFTKRPLVWTAVCSSAEVAGERHEKGASDAAEQIAGRRVTTDPKVYGRMLRQHVPDGVVHVTIATYASAHVIVEAQQDPRVPMFDLAFADEAHRAAGVGAVSPARAIALPDEHVLSVRAKRRLFQTATDRSREKIDGLADKRSKAEPAADGFLMDDTEAFGKLICQVLPSDARQRQITAPQRLVPFYIRRSELDRLRLADAEDRTPFTGLSLDDAAAAYAAIHGADAFGLRRVLAYHTTIAGAKALTGALSKAAASGLGPAMQAASIDSTQSVRAREKALDTFRADTDDRQHLVSVDTLLEGTDVRGADGVVVAARRQSYIEVKQMTSRANRRDPARPAKVATILAPVVVNDLGRDPFIEPTSRELFLDLAKGLTLGYDRPGSFGHTVEPHMARLLAPRVVADDTPDAELLPLDRLSATGAALKLREAATAHVDGALAEIRRFSPKSYRDVFWLESSKTWEARVARKRPDGAAMDTFYKAQFDSPEEAARAVDRTYELNGFSAKEYPRNFGKTVLPVTLPAQEAPKESAYKGVRYDPATNEWRASVTFQIAGTRKWIHRLATSEEDAARAHDALVSKYGVLTAVNFPDEPPRFDLIVNPDGGLAREGRARFVEPDEPTGCHWAYARHDRHVIPLGFFATQEEGIRASGSVQDAFARASDRAVDLETLRSTATRVLEREHLETATISRSSGAPRAAYGSRKGR